LFFRDDRRIIFLCFEYERNMQVETEMETREQLSISVAAYAE
jgi:hypothetical protein